MLWIKVPHNSYLHEIWFFDIRMSLLIMTSTGKCKDRQSITIETKIEIINKKEKEHKSDTELARIYNLDRSTVSNIIRNK